MNTTASAGQPLLKYHTMDRIKVKAIEPVPASVALVSGSSGMTLLSFFSSGGDFNPLLFRGKSCFSNSCAVSIVR